MNTIVRNSPFELRRQFFTVTVAVAVSAFALIGFLLTQENPSISTVYGAVAAIVIWGVLAVNAMDGAGTFLLSPFQPSAYYGVFYALYYTIPLLFLSLSGFESGLVLEISALVVAGFGCFVLGTKLSERKAKTAPKVVDVSDADIWALITVLYGALLLVASFHAIRASEGGFYTHAAGYDPAATGRNSILNVFAGSLQLPCVFLSGAYLGVRNLAQRKHIRFLFFAFAGVGTLLLVLSSQFRPSITSIAFALAGLSVSGVTKIKARHVTLAAVASVIAFLVLLGVRQQIEEEGFTGNQVVESIRRSLDVVETLEESQQSLSRQVRSRAIGQLMFAGELIQSTDAGYPFLLGKSISNGLFTLVPRVVWSSKPIMLAPQIFIRQQFGLQLYDASPGPLVQFYAEAGWTGVVLGFFVLGFLLGKVGQRMRTMSVPIMITGALLWNVVAQLETEVIIGILSALRSALVLVIIWVIVKRLLATLSFRR